MTDIVNDDEAARRAVDQSRRGGQKPWVDQKVPGQVPLGNLLSNACLAALDQLAIDREMPRLEWTIVRYSDGVVFEGFPRTTEEADGCVLWVDALGMDCYDFESREGLQIWFLNEEFWSVEVHSSPRPPGR